MPKRPPTPRRPAPILFVERMYAVRFRRKNGTYFLANSAHCHPRLHTDREGAEKFRADLSPHIEDAGKVVPVRVTIKELAR